MDAYVFPGQGAQFTGMGKDIYENSKTAAGFFDKADEVLGRPISKVMFEGPDEALKETENTQPAIFIHSVALFKAVNDKPAPKMVAGHSLGEFSALCAAGAMSFEDALKLVDIRARAMQEACEKNPSTMAAILGLRDEQVEEVCQEISEEVVVPANYNSPGQIVISGSHRGIELAVDKLKEIGAKRAMVLKVGGAFHSPLMEPAREKLAKAIQETNIKRPDCPVYQNVFPKADVNPENIKENLIAQLTAPVKWTQTIEEMLKDGAQTFTECGPGKVLQGLVKKVDRKIDTKSLSL